MNANSEGHQERLDRVAAAGHWAWASILVYRRVGSEIDAGIRTLRKGRGVGGQLAWVPVVLRGLPIG